MLPTMLPTMVRCGVCRRLTRTSPIRCTFSCHRFLATRPSPPQPPLLRAAIGAVRAGSVGLVACWLAVSDVLRRSLADESRDLLESPSEPCGDCPRWRAALGVFFQGSVVTVVAAWAASGARPSGRLAHVFMLGFPAFLLYDFATLELPTPLVLHHGFCLFCHGYVAGLGTTAAFSWYIRGVAALESGSACCNLFFLWPSEALGRTYLVAMTLSNAVTLFCMRHWVLATASPAGKALGSIVTVALVVGRQQVALESTRHACTGAEPRDA